MALTALRVSNSGSPGPAPTRVHVPNAQADGLMKDESLWLIEISRLGKYVELEVHRLALIYSIQETRM
jgi:hypothetical protein